MSVRTVIVNRRPRLLTWVAALGSTPGSDSGPFDPLSGGQSAIEKIAHTFILRQSR